MGVKLAMSSKSSIVKMKFLRVTLRKKEDYGKTFGRRMPVQVETCLVSKFRALASTGRSVVRLTPASPLTFHHPPPAHSSLSLARGAHIAIA